MALDIIHVVDDEPSVRTSLERLLRLAGYDVVAHASAEELLAWGGDGGCVILDYDLPGMNGLELHRVLATRGANWQVVFLTGSADFAVDAEALGAGAVGFLVKPAGRTDIFAALERAVERHRRADVQRRVCEPALAALEPPA